MSQNYSRLSTNASPPPEYASSDHDGDDHGYGREERDRLVEAFESDSDNEEHDDDQVFDEDWEDDRNVQTSGDSSRGGDGDNDATSTSSTPAGTGGHAVRSFFANWRFNRSTRTGAATDPNNDGVFANLTAKPDGQQNKPTDDTPPSYEEAAADATPPYWETTIMTPGYGDELFIEGLPVGSPINFVWNMMVSSAFQFVGFFLTYLLHTSHAAKQGSRAGLGFTLIQCGYYLTPAEISAPSAPPSEFRPTDPNNPDVSPFEQISGSASAPPSTTTAATNTADSSADAGSGWMSTVLLIVGCLIIIKSVIDYMHARRMEMAILSPTTENQEAEPQVATVNPPDATEAERIV